GAIMVLVSLHDLGGGGSKQEVIENIKKHKWFDLQREDWEPYPSSNSNEPRWKTFLAWAREYCAKDGLIERGIRDVWTLSKQGHNMATQVKQRFSSRVYDVRKCYLWAPSFKKYMDPQYESSSQDEPRPK